MEKPILRSLSIPEVLDKVLQIYRVNVKTLLMIGAIVTIPSVLIRSLMLVSLSDTRLTDAVLNIFLSPIMSVALITAISSSYLGGVTSIKESFSKGIKRYWTLLGTSLLIGLALVPVVLIYILLSLVGCGMIMIIFFIPAVAYLSTRWSLAATAVVLEKTGVLDSMKRSWSLTEDQFWRVFGSSFAASLLSMLLSTLPSLFVNYLFTQFIHAPLQLTSIITLVFQQLTIILASPLTIGVNVLIYYDLRIRKEGFDLLFMSEEKIEPQEIS